MPPERAKLVSFENVHVPAFDEVRFPFEAIWNKSPLPTVRSEEGEVSPIPTLFAK